MKLSFAWVRFGLLGLMLGIALGSTGCTTLLFETAKILREDRQVDAQFTDLKIGASILSGLAERDASLLLDVNADVWELRLMLTGTVADAKVRQDLIKMARADKRIKKIHDEIQVVSVAEQARRRDAASQKDVTNKKGREPAVSDFWIETKISAQLIAQQDVTSVNYRWRSVRNITYLIGRAQSKEELKTVLALINATEGVTQVKSFVEVKPLVKS